MQNFNVLNSDPEFLEVVNEVRLYDSLCDSDPELYVEEDEE